MEETLNENVSYQSKPLDLRNQRTYCVKVRDILEKSFLHFVQSLTDYFQAGVNSLLDVARQTYKEANTDATELVERLAGEVDVFSSNF